MLRKTSHHLAFSDSKGFATVRPPSTGQNVNGVYYSALNINAHLFSFFKSLSLSCYLKGLSSLGIPVLLGVTFPTGVHSCSNSQYYSHNCSNLSAVILMHQVRWVRNGQLLCQEREAIISWLPAFFCLNYFFPECLLHYQVIYLIWWSKVMSKTWYRTVLSQIQLSYSIFSDFLYDALLLWSTFLSYLLLARSNSSDVHSGPSVWPWLRVIKWEMDMKRKTMEFTWAYSSEIMVILWADVN